MRTTFLVTVAAAAALVVPGGARADHESAPVWMPVTGVTTPVAIGTGNAFCAAQSVTLQFKETTYDHATHMTRGKVFAEAVDRCSSVESGIDADMVVSVYQQDVSAGGLDLEAIGVTHRLRLLGTVRCAPRDALTDGARCRTGDIAYSHGPGVRLVGTNGTTYAIVDPRGGGWFAWHPSCKPNAQSRAKLWCLTAADARG